MTTIHWSSPTPLTIKGTSTQIFCNNSPSVIGLDHNLLIMNVGNDGKLYYTEYNMFDNTCSAPAVVPHQVNPDPTLSLGTCGLFRDGSRQIAVAYSAASNHHPLVQYLDVQSGTWSQPVDMTTYNTHAVPNCAYSPAITVLGEEFHVIAPGTSSAPRGVFDARYDLSLDAPINATTTNITQQEFRGYACEALPEDNKVLLVVGGVSNVDHGSEFYYAVYDANAQTPTWSAVRQIPGPGFTSWQSPSLQSIGDGQVVMVFNQYTTSSVVYATYDARSNTWSNSVRMPASAKSGASLVTTAEKLYCFYSSGDPQKFYVMSAPYPT